MNTSLVLTSNAQLVALSHTYVYTDSDFDGTPITITLPNPAGGTVRQVELEIPVIDDMINEHQETLVGFIQIANAIDEGTIQLRRTATQLIINDNDGNFCALLIFLLCHI